ncbi:MAG: GNAT family N-acetyltransferase [Xanthobacteraceae bacterium]|nr:GNAT family N-acetyltransferase [Xanthobacteraceae bacterium]
MLAPAKNLIIERRPLAGLADIVEPWRRLAERAVEPNVFYTPEFALAAAPALGRDVEAILVWSAERKLLGLLPLRRSSRRYGMKLPLLLGWTHPFAPLGTPLIDREATAQVAAGCLAHLAGDTSLPKLLLLPSLTEEGPVARALRAAAADRGGAHRAFAQHRRAALDLGDGRRDLDEVIGAKRMREARRLRRRLGEAGQVEFALARYPESIAPALQRFLALESQGWKGVAGTALVQSNAHRRFAEEALDALAGRGAATVAELSLHGRVIASVIVLRSGDHAWSWKMAYDERMARFSPGLQAMTDVTAMLVADDTLRFADSCAVPDHPLMDHLWRDRLAMADVMIAVRPAAGFELACRMETMRGDAIAVARRVRCVLRRATAFRS